MPDTETSPAVTDLTVQLLSAYLANNTVASADLAELIRTTKAALTEDPAAEPVQEEAVTYTPAVSVRKSLASPDFILSLIDGKPYKTLKRHLAANGLTPESYRERYNLPHNYPMVAPSFGAMRREIAEKIGLGNRRKSDAAVKTAEATPAQAKAKPAAKKSASVSAKTVKPQSDTVSVEASAAKAPAKARSPKKTAATGGKAKTSAAITAVATPAGTDTAETKAPARRGKLGLFNKDGAGKADDKSAIASAPAAAKLEGEVKAPAKTAKPKRMARTPKAPATEG